MRWFFILIICTFLIIDTNGLPMKRRKRHDNSGNMEWFDTCGLNGGEHIPINKTCVIPEHFNDALRIHIQRYEKRIQNVNLTDMHIWFGFNDTYKFLPVLNTTHVMKHPKGTCKTDINRWHSDMQIYVGAFQILLHKHKNGEIILTSVDLAELRKFKTIAKNMLCDIETVINGTSRPPIQLISRHEMDNLLKYNFYNTKYINQGIIDRKFTIVRFGEYLHNILQTLQNRSKQRKYKLKRFGSRGRHSKRIKINNTNHNNHNNNNKKLKTINKHRHHNQEQTQQQQRLRKHKSNRIDKNFNNRFIEKLS